jgi:hypothetical protein
VNEPWARWICVQLERAGYSTVLQALDFRPGHDCVHEMQAAVTSATRTIAVLSLAYFESRFGEAEWRVAFKADPSGEQGWLIPVRVRPCTLPGLLATRIFVDLVDLDEHSARDRLLAAVGPALPRPTTARSPASAGLARAGRLPLVRSAFPGAGPLVSNLRGRNRHFSGRDTLLTNLHARMRAAALTAVLPLEAVHGLGGVGKTEWAIEFGHRFGSDYDIVWWVPAERPVTAAALAELARPPGGAAGRGPSGDDRWVVRSAAPPLHGLVEEITAVLLPFADLRAVPGVGRARAFLVLVQSLRSRWSRRSCSSVPPGPRSSWERPVSVQPWR